MHIIDRLARDLGELLEREMTRRTYNPDRLTIGCLLLIGHRRGKIGFKQAANKSRIAQPATEDPTRNDEFEDKGLHSEDSFSRFKSEKAFNELREHVGAFRYANPYSRELLFRDYRSPSQYEPYPFPDFGKLEIHVEAALYVSEVLLLRRLQLARANGSRPTNMHALLQCLCRASAAEGIWVQTEIRRWPNGMRQDRPWFQNVADALRRQLESLGENMSATAKNRCDQDGLYLLLAHECAEQAGEEMCLNEVLTIAPKPLRKGFSSDDSFAKLFRKVVDSLNARYKWLRACGLPPADWLCRDKPSIDHLKQLAALRGRARETEAWHLTRYEAAFEQAFRECHAESNGKVAGFSYFRESDLPCGVPNRTAPIADTDQTVFLSSRVGQAMLDRASPQTLSFSGSLSGFDDGLGDIEIADPEADQCGTHEVRMTLAEILEDAGPRLANRSALKLFFREVLLEGRNFIGQDALANDPEYQLAIAADPLYAGLDEEQLVEMLFFDVRGLIFDVLVETSAESVDPLLQQFIRWVLVEEKPWIGTNGLIHQKSFKTLLKQRQLESFTAQELFELLHGQALDIIRELFGNRL